jgi:hypothetical protein
MSEPKDLLLVNEQLRQSNRRWKALALTACALLVLVALLGVMRAEGQRRRAEAAMRDANAAVAAAHQASVDAWNKQEKRDVTEGSR